MKIPLFVKMMRNWWNSNGIKEKSIPLSGILMDEFLIMLTYSGVFHFFPVFDPRN